ncbi:hypothetical protein NDU88_002299 [Pleurodeles waltl]|uniref:Uncharacterized protein n=1 Tax=Pleurodeles waltl TaxID=8319 RepID=A0AAV7VE36_PLEWA|nr:hypothetical protein NDU88_002299 [Pleurodeles waltl]
MRSPASYTTEDVQPAIRPCTLVYLKNALVCRGPKSRVFLCNRVTLPRKVQRRVVFNYNSWSHRIPTSVSSVSRRLFKAKVLPNSQSMAPLAHSTTAALCTNPACTIFQKDLGSSRQRHKVVAANADVPPNLSCFLRKSHPCGSANQTPITRPFPRAEYSSLLTQLMSAACCSQALDGSEAQIRLRRDILTEHVQSGAWGQK